MSVTFAEAGVPADLVSVLARKGITVPFPIQAAAIPDALAGHDVAGKAPTGSGKTLAFGLPLVAGLAKAKPGRPRGLVLVPTRELADQVAKELVPLACVRGRSVTAVYGGTGYGPQRNALKRGCDVVVACPGRLEDLISRGDVSLGAVQFVVVDEADRMADMGFLPPVKRLLDQVPSDRQTLLFSATLDGAIDELVRRYQREPKRHELAPAEDAQFDVEHQFWKVDRTKRVEITAQLVQRDSPAVVFCRTRHGADRVARQLGAAGVSAVAIHGDRTQAQRDRALASFRAGKAHALVATDVAARGIHVDGVACVVHFDPPADDKDYVHRSGRTGRAGATGLVVTLVHADVAHAVRGLQRTLGHPVETSAPDFSTTSSPAVRPAPEARDQVTANRRPGAVGAVVKRTSGGPQRASSGKRRSFSAPRDKRRTGVPRSRG